MHLPVVLLLLTSAPSGDKAPGEPAMRCEKRYLPCDEANQPGEMMCVKVVKTCTPVRNESNAPKSGRRGVQRAQK